MFALFLPLKQKNKTKLLIYTHKKSSAAAFASPHTNTITKEKKTKTFFLTAVKYKVMKNPSSKNLTSKHEKTSNQPQNQLKPAEGKKKKKVMQKIS